MSERIPKSTTSRIAFMAFLSSDHLSVATGKTIAITISKNGAAFGNPNAGATNATEIANGWYYVDLDATDTGTEGPLIIRGTSATIDDVGVLKRVVKATNGGFTALPDAAADAAGGLPISDAGGLDLDAQIGTKINDILTDTGTTLDGKLPAALAADGSMKASLSAILGTGFTEGAAGRIAAGFKALLNVAAPVFDLTSVNQTGDNYARLGAPAGASVSADVAAVKAQTAAIETDTQDLQSRLPAALTAGGNMKSDIKAINGTTVNGDGGATPWGP